MNATTPYTAKSLNDHLAAGGAVRIATHYRVTTYTKKHAGWFTAGPGASVRVRHGRKFNYIISESGLELVSIQLGTPRGSRTQPEVDELTREALAAFREEHPADWQRRIRAAWLVGDTSSIGTTLYRARNEYGELLFSL